MFSFAILSPAPGVFSDPDWTSLGLVAAMVGAFLIANATLLEHPRRLVARYFGRSSGRLQSVREYVYNRVQTTLGFGFLLLGFGMQLVGHSQPAPAGAAPLNMAWVGMMVVLAVVALFTAWWWSLWAFRRYVREYFQANPISLEREGNVAREIGELFGVDSREDDTVEAYVARLRQRAGLPRTADERGSMRLAPRTGIGTGSTLEEAEPGDFEF